MARNDDLQQENLSQPRPPFTDPLADGMDPTAPGAPHEPGGSDYHQSERQRGDAPARERPDTASARTTGTNSAAEDD